MDLARPELELYPTYLLGGIRALGSSDDEGPFGSIADCHGAKSS